MNADLTVITVLLAVLSVYATIVILVRLWLARLDRHTEEEHARITGPQRNAEELEATGTYLSALQDVHDEKQLDELKRWLDSHRHDNGKEN